MKSSLLAVGIVAAGFLLVVDAAAITQQQGPEERLGLSSSPLHTRKRPSPLLHMHTMNKAKRADDSGSGAKDNVKYTTDYYEAMPVDHFGFGTMETYRMK